MSSSGKIYFASDLHLGVPNAQTSAQREKLFLQWLDEVSKDAVAIYIIGDVFDFWHEYETVVPKGFVRLQAKLASICDAGIPVYLFTGNHDLWMYGYFEQELGVKIYRAPITISANGKKIMIGHGDGLGPGDHGYKFIKKVFSNKVCQFLFRWLHPDLGVKLASYFSRKSRYGNSSDSIKPEVFHGNEKEWLVQYCMRKLEKEHYNYFVFGHRHLPLDIQLKENSRYINTGDWLSYNSYAVFDGNQLQLKYYKGHDAQ